MVIVPGEPPVSRAPQTLDEADAAIRRGCEETARGAIAIGEALAAVRDRRLYRDEYATFEDCVHERWGLSRQSAYRMIRTAAVLHNLAAADQQLPTPSHAAALSSLPPHEQVELAPKIQRLSVREAQRLVQREKGRSARHRATPPGRVTTDARRSLHHLRRFAREAAALDPELTLSGLASLDVDDRRELIDAIGRARTALAAIHSRAEEALLADHMVSAR